MSGLERLITAVDLSIKLDNARNAMRTLYGDQWPAKSRELYPLLRAVMHEKKLAALPAALLLSRSAAAMDGGEMLALRILGSALEFIEAGEDVTP